MTKDGNPKARHKGVQDEEVDDLGGWLDDPKLDGPRDRISIGDLPQVEYDAILDEVREWVAAKIERGRSDHKWTLSGIAAKYGVHQRGVNYWSERFKRDIEAEAKARTLSPAGINDERLDALQALMMAEIGALKSRVKALEDLLSRQAASS